MKKTTYVYYYLIFASIILAISIALGYRFIYSKHPVGNTHKIVYVDRSIEPLRNRQLIIEEEEEEVSVYVDSEPVETEEVKEEVKEEVVQITKQPLDYDFNIMIPSGYTEEDLLRSLGGIRNGMEDSIGAIVVAEKTYGVNSLYLLAVLGYESGWGTVESGYNNIAGWKVDGAWSNFESRYQCIMEVANGLANDFSLDVGPRIYDISSRYTPDEGYVDTLLQIMSELEANI